jgi:hypothetical protein
MSVSGVGGADQSQDTSATQDTQEAQGADSSQATQDAQSSEQATDSAPDVESGSTATDPNAPDVDAGHANDSWANALQNSLNGDGADALNKMGGTDAVGDKAADQKDPLDKVTQKDGNPALKGEHSCGAAATSAAILKEKGTDGLQDLNKNLQQDHKDFPSSDAKENKAYADLDKASQNLPASQAAYNDALQRVMWSKQGSEPQNGTQAGTMQSMLDKAGCQRPADPSNPQNGESWPAKVNKNLDANGNAQDGHWVTHGRDDNGKEYFYDPYPGGIDGKRGGKGQVVREGDPDFAKYKAASANDYSKGRGALPKADGTQ